MTNRRQFLSLFGAAAAGLVLDPELALWVPGRKTYFTIPVQLHPVSNFGGYYFVNSQGIWYLQDLRDAEWKLISAKAWQPYSDAHPEIQW